jgi:hypothetical protein
MKLIMQSFLFISIMTILCAFSSSKTPTRVTQGNVIYSFKSGKIQCQSQIDPNGQIVILLSSLADNTYIQFQKLMRSTSKTNKNGYALKAVMLVNADTDLCAGWIDTQEVTNPIPVKEISLVGKQIYSSKKTIVLIPEDAKEPIWAQEIKNMLNLEKLNWDSKLID